MRLLAAGRFKLFICVTALLGLLAANVAWADDVNLDPDQIKAALHTATDEEQGFIDRTLSMVTDGTLPRDIFTSSFIWAAEEAPPQVPVLQAGPNVSSGCGGN